MSSSLANTFGLSNTWSLDMAALAAGSDASLASSSAWGTVSLYSGANYAFVQDPAAPPSSKQQVLQILYPQGSYQSPSNPNGAPSGGAQFYFRPFGNNLAYSRALLEYDLYLPAGFPFNMGGKLPGIYSTTTKPGGACDGGTQSDGTSCWSVRLMWRTNAAGEAYAYIPTSANTPACSSPNAMCPSNYGSSLGRGAFQFTTSQWISLAIYIQLNTPANNDGVLRVYLNNANTIAFNNIQYRGNVANTTLLIRDVVFSTFFGGNTPDWAPASSTYSLFRNIRFSAGQGYVPSSASPLWHSHAVLVFFVACIELFLVVS